MNELRSIVDAFAFRRDSLIENSKSQLEALWRATDPYDGFAVADFADRASLISAASQQHIALLSSTKLSNVFDLLTGEGLDFAANVPDEVRLFSHDEDYGYAKPVPRRTDIGFSERLPAEEVFNRPARKYRYLKSIGKSDQEALDVSVERVKIAIETNVMLAEREAEGQVLNFAKRSKNVTGYRRILHPEKSRGGCCGLCVAASDRVYSVESLKAVHARCKCEVLPIIGSMDPGGEMNAEDLRGLYAAAGSTAGADLKKLRFEIQEHGELGPILVSPRGVSVPHYAARGTLAA